MSMLKKQKVFFLGATDAHVCEENILNKVNVSSPIQLSMDNLPLLDLQFASGYKKDGTQILSCEAVLDVENLGLDNNEYIDMLDSLINAAMEHTRWVISSQINSILRKILEFWQQGKPRVFWRVFDDSDPCDPTIFYVNKDLYQYALTTSRSYIKLIEEIENKSDAFKEEYKKATKPLFSEPMNNSLRFWESIADNLKAEFRMFRLFASRDEVSIEEDFNNLKQAIMNWIKQPERSV